MAPKHRLKYQNFRNQPPRMHSFMMQLFMDMIDEYFDIDHVKVLTHPCSLKSIRTGHVACSISLGHERVAAAPDFRNSDPMF